jgi:hypothetical protein
VISHVHRTVFVHVPKTAGQGVETVFLEDLGLTWRDRAPLLMMYNDNPQVGPPRLAHLTAAEYVRHHYLSAELFASYFTFSIVRNPWDRALSMYRFQESHDPSSTLSFTDFVTKRLAGRMWRNRYWWVRPQAEYVYDEKDTALVDVVGRFECLDEMFATVRRRAGLRVEHLPRVNASGEPGGGAAAGAPPPKHFADRYDDRTAAMVASLYERDIALFGYELN